MFFLFVCNFFCILKILTWLSYWYILVFKNVQIEKFYQGLTQPKTMKPPQRCTLFIFSFFLFIGKIKDIANHGPSQDLWLYDLSLLSCLLVTAIIDFLKNLQLFVIHKVLKRNKKLLKYILIGKCQKHSPRRVL